MTFFWALTSLIFATFSFSGLHVDGHVKGINWHSVGNHRGNWLCVDPLPHSHLDFLQFGFVFVVERVFLQFLQRWRHYVHSSTPCSRRSRQMRPGPPSSSVKAPPRTMHRVLNEAHRTRANPPYLPHPQCHRSFRGVQR